MSRLDKAMSIQVKVEGVAYRLSKNKLGNWAYFDAVLAGTWGEEARELPLATDDFLEWKKLLDPKGIAAYSSVAHVADFLLPKDDSYLLQIHTDEEMTQEERLSHYRRVGHFVRREGLTQPYLSPKQGFHCNFFLDADPLNGAHRALPTTQENFDALLALTNISEITGVVHDGWLRSRAEGLKLDRSEEVPWWLLRWEDIGQIQMPNMLSESLSRNFRILSLLEPRVVPHHREQLTREQSIVVKAFTPEGSDAQAEEDYGDREEEEVVFYDDLERMRLYMTIEGDETKITTGHATSDTGLLRLFSILFQGYLDQHLYDYIQRFIYPLTGVEIQRGTVNTSKATLVGPHQVVLMVLRNVWYRGQALYQVRHAKQGNRSREAPLHTDEIALAARYGLETLGVEFMTKLAEAAMYYGEDPGDDQDDARCRARTLAFAEAVLEADKGQPMSRLP